MSPRYDNTRHPEHGYLLRDRPRFVSLGKGKRKRWCVATVLPAKLGGVVTVATQRGGYKDMVLVRRVGKRRWDLAGWRMNVVLWDGIENTDENQWKIRRAVANSKRRPISTSAPDVEPFGNPG